MNNTGPPTYGNINKLSKNFCLGSRGHRCNFYIKSKVLKCRFLAYSQGPGGFRELREAYRNHFHRSWYLSDAVVTSYSQKPFRGDFFYRVRYNVFCNSPQKTCWCWDRFLIGCLTSKHLPGGNLFYRVRYQHVSIATGVF